MSGRCSQVRRYTVFWCWNRIFMSEKQNLLVTFYRICMTSVFDTVRLLSNSFFKSDRKVEDFVLKSKTCKWETLALSVSWHLFLSSVCQDAIIRWHYLQWRCNSLRFGSCFFIIFCLNWFVAKSWNWLTFSSFSL